MIITRTPLRVSLAGGGTDFPEYYQQYSGATIGFALNRYVWVTARELPPFFPHRFRCVWSEVETVTDPATLRNPIYRAVLAGWNNHHHGLEIHYDSDLPARSGLGSSSAFAVGLLLAVETLTGNAVNPEALASAAMLTERTILGEPGGHQDQIFAAHGGYNRIHFTSDGWQVLPLLPPPALFEHLMLFYVGQARLASAIEAAKLGHLKDNLGILEEIYGQVDEVQRLIVSDRYEALGRLLDVGWRLKRRLAPGVSSPAVDDALEAAQRAGAWGGKLLGAGGAGFILVCAPPERQEAIRAALRGLVHVPVGLAASGATAFGLAP